MNYYALLGAIMSLTMRNHYNHNNNNNSTRETHIYADTGTLIQILQHDPFLGICIELLLLLFILYITLYIYLPTLYATEEMR